eukprot:480873-Prymnesium_polylepis.2
MNLGTIEVEFSEPNCPCATVSVAAATSFTFLSRIDGTAESMPHSKNMCTRPVKRNGTGYSRGVAGMNANACANGDTSKT